MKIYFSINDISALTTYAPDERRRIYRDYGIRYLRTLNFWSLLLACSIIIGSIGAMTCSQSLIFRIIELSIAGGVMGAILSQSCFSWIDKETAKLKCDKSKA